MLFFKVSANDAKSGNAKGFDGKPFKQVIQVMSEKENLLMTHYRKL